MNKIEEINNEITKLKIVLQKIDSTRISKQNAADLKSYIEIFNHSFSVDFPLCINYYRRNHSNEIDVTDGLEDLEMYANSKLKQKHDHYFWSGKEKINRGVRGLIRHLEADITLLKN